MTPEESLARAKSYLDEATENLTFDEYLWAFEEAARGAAWALNALGEPPSDSLGLGPKGQLPPASALCAAYDRAASPPKEAGVAGQLAELRDRLSGSDDLEAALARRSEEVDRLVFATWELYDACGEQLELVDRRRGDELVFAEVLPWQLTLPKVDRRRAMKLFAAAGLLPLAACDPTAGASGSDKGASQPTATPATGTDASGATVRTVEPLGNMHWKTSDPFLFCAHHRDGYPAGNAQLGPDASLAGRHLGRDFDTARDWRMYHGKQVPGFPRHPHRGFETVTVVRTGRLDHSDSLGATARYGAGDVQWLTTGRGIQHAEMFPLVKQESPNPLEMFQIWLNLPAADKMVDPHFKMLWGDEIPEVRHRDGAGRAADLKLAAGRFGDDQPPAPPPNSWGARDESDLAIWTIRLEPAARLTLPQVAEQTERTLYVHRGGGLKVAGTDVPNRRRVEIDGDGPLPLENGRRETEVLLLQGKPIDEPVAKRGPFVMNSQPEIRQAYADYRRTRFGGWPWDDDGPVHSRDKGRFARHIDGSFEEPV